jgi:hypothetical protein
MHVSLSAACNIPTNDVLAVRYGLEMSGINARPITAQVIDLEAIPDGPVKQRIGETVSKRFMPIDFQSAVAIPDDLAHPGPAIIRAAHVRKPLKSLGSGCVEHSLHLNGIAITSPSFVVNDTPTASQPLTGTPFNAARIHVGIVTNH